MRPYLTKGKLLIFKQLLIYSHAARASKNRGEGVNILVISFFDITLRHLTTPANGINSAMNTMKYRGYTARIDFDERDNIFVGEIVGMSERLSFHGASVDELRGDFEFAVDHYLAACAAAGQKPERQASGKLLVRLPAATHAAAGAMAAAEGISLNQWIGETIAARLRES